MKSPSIVDSMLTWALAYAKLGWKVFPLRTQGDLKAPHGLLGDSGGHNQATTDPAQLRAWWTRAPTAGIGLWLAGSGLLAIDADTYKPGVLAAMDRLERRHSRVSSPVQADTGGGGVHTLYVAPEGIRHPANLGGENGIDIKYNGYIVLAPSPHSRKAEDGTYRATGKRYRWQNGRDPFDNADLMPLIPQWFLSRGDGKSVTVSGKLDSDDVFVEDTPKAGLSLEQTQVLLDAVINDGSEEIDYETWLAVLQGIYHEFDGSAEGRAIAQDWSERNPKHDDEKFEKSWNSLSIEGKGRAPTTLRFLIKIGTEKIKAASAAAVVNFQTEIAEALTKDDLRKLFAAIRPVDMDPLDRQQLAIAIQEQWKAITGVKITMAQAKQQIRFEDPMLEHKPTWVEPYVYLAAEEGFIKPGQENVISRGAFDSLYNRFMLTPHERAQGETEPYNRAANAALNRWMIDTADRRMYMPDADTFFQFGNATCFNTFSDAEQPPVPDRFTAGDLAAVRIVQEHFANLAPDKRTCEILISWLAYIVQTHKRPNWAIIIQSPEGEGKSFFTELMGAILGASNVGILDPDILTGRFSGWAEGHLLKIIEEIKLHGDDRFRILDRMKAYITNPTVSIEHKGEKNKTIRNTAGYLMFTNYRDSIPVREGDTRYFMLASPRQTIHAVRQFKQQNPDYYENLFEVIDTSAGAIRKWLLTYKLHHEFKEHGRAPWSAEKDYVISLNVPTAEREVLDILAAGHAGLSADLCDATLLLDRLVENGETHLTSRALEGILTRHGFTRIQRAKVDGRNRTYWSQSPALFQHVNPAVARSKLRSYLVAATAGDI